MYGRAKSRTSLCKLTLTDRQTDGKSDLMFSEARKENIFHVWLIWPFFLCGGLAMH